MKTLLYGIIINLFTFNLVYSSNITTLTYDQQIIAMTILGEARNQKEEGMYAVGCVIQARMGSTKTGAQVCLKNNGKVWQFSCWDPKDPNRAKLRGLLNSNNKQAQYAKRLALNIGKLQTSFVNHADHYCTINSNPYWIKNKKPVKIIRQHKFFKLK